MVEAILANVGIVGEEFAMQCDCLERTECACGITGFDDFDDAVASGGLLKILWIWKIVLGIMNCYEVITIVG